MMRWQQSQDNGDEHDAPTEPLMPVILSPSSAMIAGEVIPTPTPQERPFPVQQAAASPFAPYGRYGQNGQNGQSSPSVYPVLPPSPIQSQGYRRPPGSAMPAGYPGSTDGPAQATRERSWRSSLPLFVEMFLVVVQLLLLVRFVLKLIGLNGGTAWVGVVYALSGVFVLPFRLLLQNIAVPIPTAFEIYTLLAILMYGLLSRLLARFLKALLRSR